MASARRGQGNRHALFAWVSSASQAVRRHLNHVGAAVETLIDTIWVVVISSGAAVIGWLLWGLTTGGAIIVAALGVVSASRAPIEPT